MTKVFTITFIIVPRSEAWRQIKNSKFVISNARVDRSKLEVSVNSNGIVSKYSLSTEVSTITSSSRVFYAQENEEGFLEIYFGDDVLGQALADGNIVILEYVVCNEDDPNGASEFTLQSAVGGSTNATITTVINAQNGGPRESMDSIKFNARPQVLINIFHYL